MSNYSTMPNWAVRRPIYALLPKLLNPYGDPVNDWLTQYWDELFVNAANQLINLVDYFNPQTCPVEWLDLIAPLYGFGPPYYSKSWPVQAKRNILSNALTNIWPKVGQSDPFLFIANELGLLVKLRIPGDFILSGPYESPAIIGSQLNLDQMGSRGWEIDVLMPVSYQNEPAKVAHIKQLVYLYLPTYLQIEYIYTDQPFYTDLLAADETTLIEIEPNYVLRLQ